MLNLHEVYIQLMNFKSITFHHQGNYFIRMKMQFGEGKQPVRAIPSIRTHKMVKGTSSKFIKSSQGNEHMLFGSIWQTYSFETNKQLFEIMYNDQTVYFDIGCVFRLERREKEKKIELKQGKKKDSLQQMKIKGYDDHAEVSIQLWQEVATFQKDGVVVELDPPELRKVSTEILMVNLGRWLDNQLYHHSPFCFIPFTTSEYFSSLQICIYQAPFGSKLNLEGVPLHKFIKMRAEIQEDMIGCYSKKGKGKRKNFKTFKEFYVKMVRQKLIYHHQLRKILNHQVQIYKKNKIKQSKYAYLNKISPQFEDEIVFRQIPNLNHLGVELADEEQQSDSFKRPQSQEFIRKKQMDSFQSLHNNLKLALQEKYQCDSQQIYDHILQESQLIQINIQYLFERILQISLVQNRSNQREVLEEEIKKIQDMQKLIEVSATTQSQAHTDTSILIEDEQQSNPSKSKLMKKRKQTIHKYLKQSSFYLTRTINQPIIFDIKSSPLEKKYESLRKFVQVRRQSQILVVLVHGYKGNEFDLSKIKSYINLFMNLHHFLSLKSIQEHIEQSIEDLGVRGADELISYLEKRKDIKLINFIGFSLGGLIIRAMLPHLQRFKDKFNYLVTFASPHLGVGMVRSCLVKTGIFYMNKILGVKNIKELCNDRVQKEETTLEELAKEKSLGWLKGAILIGSDHDHYVQTYSALAQYNGSDESIQKMEANFNSNLKNIIRKSVWFDFQGSETFWDKLTHRKGHISFLEDDQFIQYFCIKYRKELLPHQ